ncbi:riboflavin biosynthesis pyrimidine reductase [Marisediminicola sp. UYEF4]|uniref:pyrimidine reductase family protein n=1 Tax=Marisediminicola sp. UYEF4 TaxID=1756384 RepID=UPI0033936A71
MLDRHELIERYRVADRAMPRLRVNFIQSLDGAVTRDGVSGGLNNDDDKLVFDTLRMLCDVIVVGAGTVRAEGYSGVRVDDEDAAWRVAHALAAQPPVALVTSRLDFAPSHPFFADAVVRPIVITSAASPTAAREALADVADVLVCGEERVEPDRLVAELTARGLPQMLCEGGPQLFGALIEADRVDEICLTMSPVLEGGPAGRIAHGEAATAREMALLHVLTARDMLFLRYERRT